MPQRALPHRCRASAESTSDRGSLDTGSALRQPWEMHKRPGQHRSNTDPKPGQRACQRAPNAGTPTVKSKAGETSDRGRAFARVLRARPTRSAQIGGKPQPNTGSARQINCGPRADKRMLKGPHKEPVPGKFRSRTGPPSSPGRATSAAVPSKHPTSGEALSRPSQHRSQAK
jgi:hypothetical protein